MSRSSRVQGRRELPEHPLVAEAIAALRGERKVYLVKAPPGSGKTTLLLGVLRQLQGKRMRLAVATQTNSQAEDLCQRWIGHGLGPITRLASSNNKITPREGIQVCTGAADLPTGPCIVVGNTKKWAWTQDIDPFDILFIDEAWQMPWADFATLPHVAANFMLIGDPGQIQPIVTVDTSRWEVAPVPPHRPAPEVLLARKIGACGAIDRTYRLPRDTAGMVQSFYDFPFAAVAKGGDRRLIADPTGGGKIADLIARAADCSIVAATRSMPVHGTVPEDDPEIAIDVAKIVHHLLRCKGQLEMDGTRRPLDVESIGIVATHRVMISSIRDKLEGAAKSISLDTPERWQGLEKPVMVAVHPLSSTRNPSAFDLATGRLCVMASRHKVAMFVVSRDHVAETLSDSLPDATQAPSQPDGVGIGHARHSHFWRSMQQDDRSVALG
jgi:hypothetical protein